MPASRPFHVMAKPIGPQCNLRCSYCFYLEKEALFPQRSSRRMNDDTLEAFVRHYIGAQHGDRVVFAWQGGEPTLLGIDYFRKVIALQRRYADGRRIENALQTNGTLLDAEWGAFLKEHEFLVGISIDGPAALHDRHRLDLQRRGTLRAVLRGLEVLQRHDVAFNTLTCVSTANCDKPLEVYRFLKRIGSRHLQFIPVVELAADKADCGDGLKLRVPMRRPDGTPRLAPWSITGEQWGRFLTAIFDRWVQHDVGEVYVDMFELSLAKWLGIRGGMCVHNETCGDALAVEHDGTVYSCDHYVYPEFRLGSILDQTLSELVDSPQQQAFGLDKRQGLSAQCLRCPVLFACNGGCPKHRFTAKNAEAHSHLCAGYFAYFNHIDPPMRVMANLYRRGQSPAMIKSMVTGSRDP